MSTGNLRLNGWNVPGFSMRVSGGMDMLTEDISGETSGTDRVEKGIKPKTLTVSLYIRFADEEKLRELVRKAEAKDTNGAQVVYTIANREAGAANIRQVRFSDSFRWAPVDGKQMWSVSFTLKEYLSVPEKQEQREQPKQTVEQTSDGKEVEVQQAPAEQTNTDAGTGTGTGTDAPLSSFEQVLASIDEWLA